MLTIVVKGPELYNSETNEFFREELFSFRIEHSLVSLSKWEEKYEKPFLSRKEKTPEEMLDYILMMCVDEDVTLDMLQMMDQENVDSINSYINAKKSATWFTDPKGQSSGETITSELLYYWMSAFQIDWQAQYWHLNRLFTLIRVANLKNQPQKKMSQKSAAQRMKEVNAARREQYGSKG